MKNYIAISLFVSCCVMVSLQGSDAGDRDVRGVEVLAADAVIPETLRVKLLAGMLQAKLYSFAPYDGSLISQRNRHKSVSQGDPEFIVAVWEVEKYIQFYAKPECQNIPLIQVCLEWLFDRIIDLELNTDTVLPEIVNVLNCVGKDIGYTESIRNLIAEEVADDSDDDSVQGVVGDTSRDESMVSTDSGSVFDEYYAEQKKAFITALWEWALRKSCIMQ